MIFFKKELKLLCKPAGERVKETREDKSLEAWRKLADVKAKGFKWKRNLLFHTVTDNVLQSVYVLVLPRSCRIRVLKTAHDSTGHLGNRKVLQMLRRRFTWPLMTKDVVRHCQSCETCQRCSRASIRKAPMVERPVLTEPFEQVAFDLVGPLPKAKGGYR